MVFGCTRVRARTIWRICLLGAITSCAGGLCVASYFDRYRLVGVVLAGVPGYQWDNAGDAPWKLAIWRGKLCVAVSWYPDRPDELETWEVGYCGFLFFQERVGSVFCSRPDLPWAAIHARLPVPALIACLWVLPAYRAVKSLRGRLDKERRRRHGRCVACGYDLTGNVSGLCSECGSPAPSQRS